jgi:hypothetical protein
MLAEQKVEMLLTLGRTADARAVLRDLPGDEDFYRLAREAGIVLAEGGPAKLRAWMAENELSSRATTGAELAELARLQLLANQAVAARATLVYADRILPLSTADLYDGSQIRHQYSAALVRACIEIKGGGDHERALRMLAALDTMLDTYEKNGGVHYGLFAMRAESFALQGNRAAAQAALDTAWRRGWRATWRARLEPYLAGLAIPSP